MASELQLNTSLTFQFILAQSTYPAIARSSNSTPNLHLIRQALSLPLQATCSACGKSHTLNLPLSEASYSSDDSEWYVASDPEITPMLDETDALGSGQKYFHFHGVKIKTPMLDKEHLETTMTDGDLDHIHTVSMRGEITAVLKQLQARLGKLYEDSQAWLFPSTHSSILVHFSNAETVFPVTTVKKVSFMMVAWQRLIDSLHDTHRIAQKPLFEDGLDVHLDAWLEQIKKAPGTRSIIQLMTGAKRANIIDVEQVPETGHITFGQQASSFDSNAILVWVDVLTKVVSRAHYAEGTFFAFQFSGDGEYRAAGYNTDNMLRDLNVKKSTILYYRSKAKDTISQLDEDLAAALEATARNDLLGPLAMQVANSAMTHRNQQRVCELICKKMKNGGYGRVNKCYIDAVEAGPVRKAQIMEDPHRDDWLFMRRTGR